jgi:hypothetical protein
MEEEQPRMEIPKEVKLFEAIPDPAGISELTDS